MSEKRIKNESGMITVEAVLSLVPFVLVILGIISFINVFMVHNKVQYALFQTGSEISSYSYFYQALGIRSADLKLAGDISTETKDVDAAIESVVGVFSQMQTVKNTASSVGQNGVTNVGNELNDLAGEVQSLFDQGKSAYEIGKQLISDPQGLLRGLIYLGVEKAEGTAKTLLLEVMAASLMDNYLVDKQWDSTSGIYTTVSADAYLERMGVVGGMDGLDFGKSQMFNDVYVDASGEEQAEYRMIDIVVEYDLEIYFFKLFKKNPTIHVVQRCAIPGWLDGDGVTSDKLGD